MSNIDQNSSKSNGLGVDPLQRLASFKAPRDLSLGSAKPNKKVFTPNLNVCRNKNKTPVPVLNRNDKRDEKGKGNRKNDRNKNLKNAPKVIKSSGVFSEGLGAVERHVSRGSYGSRDAEPTAVLQKPTIRVKDVIKIDKESEDRKIKAVMGELGTPGGDGVDFKTINEKDAPIKLPMDDGGITQKPKAKPAVIVKEEVIIKTEPDDDLEITSAPRVQTMVGVKQEACEDTDVVNLLRNPKPTLILLQFPDSLPGRGGVEDEPRPSSTSKTTDEDSAAKSDSRCRLSDLEEGRLGTLRIHRSGRVTLALGDTLFDVSSGMMSSFYQEAVSVAASETERSARLTALGSLRHKLSIVPHWPALLTHT